MPDTHRDDPRDDPQKVTPQKVTADDPAPAAAPLTQDAEAAQDAGEADVAVCATCGRPRPAGGCGCAQDAPPAPEGWAPLAARGDRPRLPLTGKP